MKAKKGISLIVLVITIIVIIILAGAVILSLQNNNPIEQAQKAQYVSDKDSIQSEVTLALSTKMGETSKAYYVDTDGKTYRQISGTSLPVIADGINDDAANTPDIVTLDEALPTDGNWFVTKNGKVTYVVRGWDVSSNDFKVGSDGNFESTADFANVVNVVNP